MDDDANHRLPVVSTYALVVELRAAVTRLQNIDVQLGDLDLALKEDREEVEIYINDIADCCDRIKAIDEFVRELEADNIPAVPDKALVLADIAEEREEGKSMLKLLGGARTYHEQQIQKSQTQLTVLREEKLALQKKSSQIFCLFDRNGVFELMRQRLAEHNPKIL